MSLSPKQRYHEYLQQDNFVADQQQVIAVDALESLYHTILGQTKHTKGLYIWGDVGRGKTFLMDLFYLSLTEKKKSRLHFHHFMAKVHQDLAKNSGHINPLKRIAKQIAQECRILCFDEFFVSDIADAMLLGRLFEALFAHGVILVATSNIAIENLYLNGLHRQQFLPTIKLLQQYTEQLHLNGEQDHRLRHLTYVQTYFIATQCQLAQVYGQLATVKTDQQLTESITILGRKIKTVNHNNQVVWFNFSDLCEGARSQLDYMAIAKKYHTILLAKVPQLGGECRSWIRARGTEDGVEATVTGERQLSYATQDDAARRFISLVDELYDQNVKLYISADVPLAQLYAQGALCFEFKRTFSRLSEMQSLEYLQTALS